MRPLRPLLLAAGLAAGRGLEDASALVQRGLRPVDPHTDLLGTLFSAGRGKFNCTRWPQMCQEPFNCHKYNAFKSVTWYSRGVAVDGHSNPQVLCTQPWSSDYYTKCLVEKDPVGAAHLYYNRTVAGQYGHKEHKLELDASICFLEGYCAEDRVQSNTTMEEAEAVCDSRYGRERWMVTDSVKADKKDRFSSSIGSLTEFENSMTGLHSRTQSTPLAMAACAKGYFHCEVVYCKETFCKDVYYQERYGRFLQKYKEQALELARQEQQTTTQGVHVPDAIDALFDA